MDTASKFKRTSTNYFIGFLLISMNRKVVVNLYTFRLDLYELWLYCIANGSSWLMPPLMTCLKKGEWLNDAVRRRCSSKQCTVYLVQTGTRTGVSREMVRYGEPLSGLNVVRGRMSEGSTRSTPTQLRVHLLQVLHVKINKSLSYES